MRSMLTTYRKIRRRLSFRHWYHHLTPYFRKIPKGKVGLCLLIYFLLIHPILVMPQFTFVNFCDSGDEPEGWNPSWGHYSVLISGTETLFEGLYVRIPPSKVKINLDGFRGRLVKKGKHQTLRIGGFGDSFAFGWGVEESETFLAQLESLLRKNLQIPVEVLNFGVPAQSLASEVFNLQSRMDYEMDIVLFFITANILSQEPVNRFFERALRISFNTIFIRHTLYFYTRMMAVRYLFEDYQFSEKTIQFFFEKLKHLNVQGGFDLYIIQLGALPREAKVRDLIQENDFHHCHLLGAGSATIPMDRHPNAEGHKRIAHQILECLLTDTHFRERSMLP